MDWSDATGCFERFRSEIAFHILNRKGGVKPPLSFKFSPNWKQRGFFHLWLGFAIEKLGPTNRFILHPVDAVFPDIPWDAVKTLIEARDGCM
jgi:hypothetical protein